MLRTDIKEIWTHLGGPNSLSVDDPSLSTDSCNIKIKLMHFCATDIAIIGVYHCSEQVNNTLRIYFKVTIAICSKTPWRPARKPPNRLPLCKKKTYIIRKTHLGASPFGFLSSTIFRWHHT